MRRVTVYDSMSRETRLFQPRFPPRVGMFVCGVTPYDEAHLGHGRFAIVFDVVARALRHWGYRVFYVQNVTNLDDKVIRAASEVGVDPLELSAHHFRAWQALMTRLEVTSVDYYPFATDYVPEILEQISALERAGLAYRADDGSVYYAVARFPRFGMLSGQSVEGLRPGARVEVDQRKRAPEDFVLWKAATPGEPSWDSPWGPGRPGWHIEDTAITGRLLGDQYDLHGGGLDLIFPHHEAEIAQAEGASGRAPLVQYWMHNGLLMMSGEKMSKSLGNVASLGAALDRYGPMPVRLYYLNAHYRSPLDFTPNDSLDAAREAYDRLSAPYRRVVEAMTTASAEGQELPEALTTRADRVIHDMDEAMADDFHTRETIALLFGWGRVIFEREPELGRLSASALSILASPFEWGRAVLGLFGDVEHGGSPEELAAVVGVAIEARARARARGDYAEADRIREELSHAGIRLEDGAGRTRFERTTPNGDAP